MNNSLEPLAQHAVERLRSAGLTVATAESCTGGLIAASITAIPGASSVFQYGWVTYSRLAKEQLLAVPADLIEQYSVVSEPVVAAMAQNAMRQSGSDLAIAVSGNAGPTAAEGEPPVGTVCLAVTRRGSQRGTHQETLYRPELSRNELRSLVAARALELIAGAAEN